MAKLFISTALLITLSTGVPGAAAEELHSRKRTAHRWAVTEAGRQCVRIEECESERHLAPFLSLEELLPYGELHGNTHMFGIGVQSLLSSAEQRPDIGQKPTAQIAASSIALHDEQHAFLDALEKRAPHGYSVRGNFTAAVANTHGRRKAVALGCPSFMLNPDPCLGASLAREVPRTREHAR